MLRLKLKNKDQLLMIFLVVGFFIGVIYQNLISKTDMMSIEFFSKSNLQRYLQTEVIVEKYIWYVVKDRVFLFLILCTLSCIKWKKAFVCLCLLSIGCVAGSICVAATLSLGIKGILLCLAGFFPHMIFYSLLYGMLFVHWFHYPERQWTRIKLLFVSLMFIIGLLLEIYVNPIIVKYVIGLL